MTWFKVDDKLHSHKKAARAGIAAMGLWSVAGSWCADQLTDGFVPDYIAHRLAPGEADELAERLVKAGLWTVDTEDGDDGWRFHGWDEYQPTREDVESQRERERDKKRNQRRTKGGRFESSPRESPDPSPGDAVGDAPGESVGSPAVPSRPVPTRTKPLEPDGDAAAPHSWPRVVNDGTYTNQILTWAKANGHQRRCATPADRTRWALDLAAETLGGGNRYDGAAAELVVEWVEKVAGERLSHAARKHLVRLLRAEGPLLTFRAMETAVTSGAGLGEHAEDPQSLVKFANACLRRWRAEGTAA